MQPQGTPACDLPAEPHNLLDEQPPEDQQPGHEHRSQHRQQPPLDNCLLHRETKFDKSLPLHKRCQPLPRRPQTVEPEKAAAPHPEQIAVDQVFVGQHHQFELVLLNTQRNQRLR